MTLTIEHLPFKRTWLCDIIEELLRAPDGTDHVDAIVNRLMQTGRTMGEFPKETVTRVINDYCMNANDSDRVAEIVLFRRVKAGVYRLVTYPSRPDLTETRKIEFEDPTYGNAWRRFQAELEYAGKGSEWKGMAQRTKLLAFIRHAVSTDGKFHYLFHEPDEID
jgi:hypothetical protein